MSQKPKPGPSQTLMPGSISVGCNEFGAIDCKRCGRQLRLSQVAFLTRVGEDELFEAWCIDCSLTLSRWALAGAIELGAADSALWEYIRGGDLL